MISPDTSRGDYLYNMAIAAINYGFTPIPVRGKAPVVRNWPQIRNDPSDLEKNARRVRNLVNAGTANNIGVVTGEASGIIVFDIDDPKYWQQLVELNGGIDETFTVLTGTGGKHVYFRYRPDLANLKNRNRILGQKIDFRTNGGVIVFPGSINLTTNQVYKVESGYTNNIPKIAELPIWLQNFAIMG